mmetsp:Transcript_15406/g.18729  ORF Transcript_15406/g.18729 Transcript_15406/m.18729 type:complete len:233 (+) Transcript_15406:143-841(+)
MKLVSLLLVSTCLTTSAFGVTQTTVVKKSAGFNNKQVAFKTSASASPLFRDASITRGGAVPGWAAYNESLEKSPLTTKAFTSLVGFLLGDLLAQVFITGGPLDVKRLITLTSFGFLYHGPSGHYFYNWLDSKIEGTGAKAVFSKVAIDQLLWCPIFMTVFFSYLGLVGGDSLATIADKIKSDLFTAMQGSWKVWPIVHAVNFRFISTKHRLLFINVVQIGFNIFLSLIGSKA